MNNNLTTSPFIKAIEDLDPLSDYRILAQSFAWDALLENLIQGTKSTAVPPRVLDIACGSSRWLDALYHYKHNKINSFKLSMIILILSISWGIHAVLHFLEEYIYDFEPISGSMKVLTKPIRV